MQSNAGGLGVVDLFNYLHLFMQKFDVLDRLEQHRCCISLKIKMNYRYEMVRLRHSFAVSLLAQSKFQYTTLATWEYLPEWRNDLLQCCDLLSYLHFRHLLLHLFFLFQIIISLH